MQVMEKLVDVVCFLHMEIDEAFGIAGEFFGVILCSTIAIPYHHQPCSVFLSWKTLLFNSLHLQIVMDQLKA